MKNKQPIYLDHHATTPLDPRVLEAMLPYLKENFGNAASRNHFFGKVAETAVENARKEIAKAIGANDPDEIIFTSGATESNNLAIAGLADIYRDKGNHIITSAVEHRSVLDVCGQLEENGFRVTYLPVNREGLISLADLKSEITAKTILISIMHANNEIGVLQPIQEIGKIAKERKIFFHCDAVQSIGKIPVNVQDLNVDLLSISAHKVYGPKGIGALYVRKNNPRVRIKPLLYGGGQEQGLRSGTLNVPAIAGFGTALQIAMKEMPQESKRLLAIREKLRMRIMENLSEVYVNGSLSERLPGNLNLSFAYVEGESLLISLSDDLAVSSGSACTQFSLEPSYVLKAIGIESGLEHASLRFGLGRFNTEDEIDYAVDLVIKVVTHLRELSPLYQDVQKKTESVSGRIK